MIVKKCKQSDDCYIVMLCDSSALSVCSVELLLKIGTLLMEMISYEKTLDSFIELLRKDEVSLRTGFVLHIDSHLRLWFT